MARQFLFSNNVVLELAADLNSGVTSFDVVSAASLPSPTASQRIALTLEDFTTGDLEVIHVTNVSGNTLTVDRQQEGTTSPATFNAATTVVEGRLTKEVMEQLGQVITDTPTVNTFAQYDSVGQLISGLPLEVDSSQPTTNFDGKLWYDPVLTKLQVYNASAYEVPGVFLPPFGSFPGNPSDGQVSGFDNGLIQPNVFFRQNNTWVPLASAFRYDGSTGYISPLAWEGAVRHSGDTYELTIGDGNGSTWYQVNPNYYQPAAPANPFDGQIWVDSDTDVAYIYDGAVFQEITANAGTPLDVQDSGVSQEANTDTINFTGDLAVTPGPAGTVTVDFTETPETPLDVQDSGVSQEANTDTINFTGDLAVTPGVAGTVDVGFTETPETARAVENEGVSVVADANTLDFTGDGVTASDATGGEATINVPGISVAAAEPVGGVQGQGWHDTDTDEFRIHDGTSFELVNPNRVQGTAPTNPFTGQIWKDTTTGDAFIWDGDSWELIYEATDATSHYSHGYLAGTGDSARFSTTTLSNGTGSSFSCATVTVNDATNGFIFEADEPCIVEYNYDLSGLSDNLGGGRASLVAAANFTPGAALSAMPSEGFFRIAYNRTSVANTAPSGLGVAVAGSVRLTSPSKLQFFRQLTRIDAATIQQTLTITAYRSV